MREKRSCVRMHRFVVSILVLLLVSHWTPALHAEWYEEGNPVCTATGDQDFNSVQSIPDGAGGAIIVWEDHRGVGAYIYAQRLNAAGTALWAYDGVCICNAPGRYDRQRFPKIISDNAGGAVIVWLDYRNTDPAGNMAELWAQRIAGNGSRYWQENGIRVNTSPGSRNQDMGLATDGGNGAIIAWHRGYNANVVCCQRVDGAGVKWNADDAECLVLSTRGSAPSITTDGAGGAIISWVSDISGVGGGIKAQRVSGAGSKLWASSGVNITWSYSHEPEIVSDGAGGAIIAWNDFRSGSTNDIYAQRVNSSGGVYWTANGIAVCTAAGEQRESRIVSNGSSGAFIIWYDSRNNGDIYLASVSAGGVSSNAVPISALLPTLYDHTIVSDGMGGAYISWYDVRSGHYGIYGQRVSTAGAPQWTTNGLALYTAYGTVRKQPALAPDGVGGVIAAWEDARDGNFDIYAKRYTAQGEIPIATLLQGYAASSNGGEITVTWKLFTTGEGMEFSISRAEASSGQFEGISNPAISREGFEFSFTDRAVEPGSTYLYRVEVSDEAGRRILFETGRLAVPAMAMALYQNSPNPFNPSTTIRYYLPEQAHVTLDVFDVSGRRVTRLVDGERTRGAHSIEWTGRDHRGSIVPSGMYVCQMRTGQQIFSRKMILLR